jgi:hypothetical protein
VLINNKRSVCKTNFIGKITIIHFEKKGFEKFEGDRKSFSIAKGP